MAGEKTGYSRIRILLALGLLVAGGCGQTAWGVPVGITVQISTIDFGRVTPGTVATQTLTISNGSAVDITAIIGPPQGPGGPFFATNPPANGVLNIASGEIQSLEVSYEPRPESPNPAEAYFSVRWCESSNACEYLVSLRGQK